jgi:hypothetical protein
MLCSKDCFIAIVVSDRKLTYCLATQLLFRFGLAVHAAIPDHGPTHRRSIGFVFGKANLLLGEDYVIGAAEPVFALNQFDELFFGKTTLPGHASYVLGFDVGSFALMAHVCPHLRLTGIRAMSHIVELLVIGVFAPGVLESFAE